MAYQSAQFDAAIGAAAGDDPGLLAELRAAFAESVLRQLDLMRRSRCDGNWRVAADRLRGIAASFHATELVSLADEALAGAPGDPGVLARIDAFASGLATED